MSCGVGCRCGSDLEWLWLWCRPAAVALIRLLAWEPPCAVGVALKNKTKQKNHQKKKNLRGSASSRSGCWLSPSPLCRGCPPRAAPESGVGAGAPAPGRLVGFASLPALRRLVSQHPCPMPSPPGTHTQWPSCQIQLSEPRIFAINISCVKQHCRNNTYEI